MFSKSLDRKTASLAPSSITGDALATVATVGTLLFLIGVLFTQQFDDRSSQPYLLMLGVLGLVLSALAVARLRKRLSFTDSLERQLVAFSANKPELESSLHEVLDSSPVSAGWNTLVTRFTNKIDDEEIERRLGTEQQNAGTGKLARALRSIPEGMAISDSLGTVTYRNKAWCGILGEQDIESELDLLTSLQAALFTNWEEVRDRILDGVRPSKWELTRGKMIHDGVLRLERTPMNGRNGEQPGFVWTLKDVTQNALARESHEQFLSSATHELRTPLTNIKAYSESLIEMDDITPTQQKEFFNVIHSEAERLGRLLNQLLDIQQLEAGSMTITVGKFDVHRMAHELKEHIEPLTKEKKIQFHCRIAPDLRTIEADKEKIISCMVNLLGNAVKYTPAGGEVRLIAEHSEGSIFLSVEDTGIGIAEAELGKIFERFYRCNDDRVAELEGNGLGLAFAMEVARLHNGDIIVDSQINAGSRFSLKLPLAIEAN